MWWRAGHFNTNWFAEHSATALPRHATDCHPDATRSTATTRSPRRRSSLRLPKRADDVAVPRDETGRFQNEYQDDTGAPKTTKRSAWNRRCASAIRGRRQNGGCGISAASHGHAPRWIMERGEHGHWLRKLSDRCRKARGAGLDPRSVGERCAVCCRSVHRRTRRRRCFVIQRRDGRHRQNGWHTDLVSDGTAAREGLERKSGDVSSGVSWISPRAWV